MYNYYYFKGSIAGQRKVEINDIYFNIGLLLLNSLVASFASYVISPSLYKFITTPSTEPEELQCEANSEVSLATLLIFITFDQ